MTMISRVDLKDPVIRTKSSIVSQPTRDHTERVTDEVSGLREKLRILSKAYYDIREELREQEEKNIALRTEMEKMKQDFNQQELVHEAYKKQQEKTLRNKMKIRIPSVEKLTKMREKMKIVRVNLEKQKKETEEWKRKYENNEKSYEIMRENVLKMEKDLEVYVDKIDDLQKKLHKATSFQDRISQEKRSEMVKVNSKIFKLNRSLEKRAKQFEEMKKENASLKKKIEQYKNYMKRTQLSQRKTNTEMKRIQNRNFMIQTALSNEYRNSQSREEVISKMREHIRLLRQKIRMINEPKQSVNTSHQEEQDFFRLIKLQVDRIADELDMTKRTGPVVD